MHTCTYPNHTKHLQAIKASACRHILTACSLNSHSPSSRPLSPISHVGEPRWDAFRTPQRVRKWSWGEEGQGGEPGLQCYPQMYHRPEEGGQGCILPLRSRTTPSEGEPVWLGILSTRCPERTGEISQRQPWWGPMVLQAVLRQRGQEKGHQEPACALLPWLWCRHGFSPPTDTRIELQQLEV